MGPEAYSQSVHWAIFRRKLNLWAGNQRLDADRRSSLARSGKWWHHGAGQHLRL